MKYVVETDIRFNPNKLLIDYKNILFLLDQLKVKKVDQINIRKRAGEHNLDGLFDHSGSLFGKDGEPLADDREWDSYIRYYDNTYTKEICQQLEQFAEYTFQGKIGRIRYLTMAPKSVLTYHVDYDNIVRLHIPLITNDNCFFINNEVISRMDRVGALYTFDSTVPHTAVNASREPRTHIVASVYK
jgi:hypothetical protein